MNEWLYRRNNIGKPCKWRAFIDADGKIIVQYGNVGGKILTEKYPVKLKDANAEIKSRYNDKRKTGYRPIDEIKDDNFRPPVGEGDDPILYNWLNTYLEHDRYDANGLLLPMLAKAFDKNTFKKVPLYYGQWKINGLRCIIRAIPADDMFSPYKFTFQSREGTFWHTLDTLASFMFQYLPTNIINHMINDGWALDGEIYLPGHSVNAIDHFVKDPNCIQNKLLQYWCYDLIIPDSSQETRFNYLYTVLEGFRIKENIDYDRHINNQNLFNVLPIYEVDNKDKATEYRNQFINAGFEGVILRNPDVDYQFGKRSAEYMVKYKDVHEGNFQIVNIYPEKSRYLPIILCRNDINDELFETRFSYTTSRQADILENKEKYIGKMIYLTYGERSGIRRVPFHVKEVKLIE